MRLIAREILKFVFKSILSSIIWHLWNILNGFNEAGRCMNLLNSLSWYLIIFNWIVVSYLSLETFCQTNYQLKGCFVTSLMNQWVCLAQHFFFDLFHLLIFQNAGTIICILLIALQVTWTFNANLGFSWWVRHRLKTSLVS